MLYHHQDAAEQEADHNGCCVSDCEPCGVKEEKCADRLPSRHEHYANSNGSSLNPHSPPFEPAAARPPPDQEDLPSDPGYPEGLSTPDRHARGSPYARESRRYRGASDQAFRNGITHRLTRLEAKIDLLVSSRNTCPCLGETIQAAIRDLTLACNTTYESLYESGGCPCLNQAKSGIDNETTQARGRRSDHAGSETANEQQGGEQHAHSDPRQHEEQQQSSETAHQPVLSGRQRRRQRRRQWDGSFAGSDESDRETDSEELDTNQQQ